jgi:AbiTii
MLIDEIIALLSAGEGKTTEALLKTKILLHQIGKKELVGWVNNELSGYPDSDTVPPYRILPSQVLANVSNMAWEATSHPIPLGHLKEANRETFTKSRMTQSLAALEDLARKDGHVIRPIPMELNASLGKGLANEFRIQRAWCEISVHDIKDIIVNVRSRLLDFLLELKGNVGEPASESELKERATLFDTTNLFNNSIFGDNTTIVVGNRNVQTVSYTDSTENVIDEVRKLIADVNRALPSSGLSNSVQQKAEGALSELEAAAGAPTVDTGRVRRGLESLKHVMEHAAGHVVGAGVLSLIANLLTRLPH